MIIDEYECYMYKKKGRKRDIRISIGIGYYILKPAWNRHAWKEYIYVLQNIYIYIFIKNRIFMKYLIIIIILLESFKFMIYIKVASIINKYNLVYEKK